jgi:hypothetical protein
MEAILSGLGVSENDPPIILRPGDSALLEERRESRVETVALAAAARLAATASGLPSTPQAWKTYGRLKSEP